METTRKDKRTQNHDFQPSVATEDTLLEISTNGGQHHGTHARTPKREIGSIIQALSTAGLIAKRDPTGRESFQNQTLTTAGRAVLTKILRRRSREEEGLPIGQWRTDRHPNRTRPEDFPDYALLQAEARRGEAHQVYHTDGHLLLLGPHPNPKRQVPGSIVMDATPIVEPMNWAAKKTTPIGYLFDGSLAVIAFDTEGVYLSAENYEIMLAHSSEPRSWYALTPHKQPPKTPYKSYSSMRLDSTGVTGVAWAALYLYQRKNTPKGIARLLKRTKGNN